MPEKLVGSSGKNQKIIIAQKEYFSERNNIFLYLQYVGGSGVTMSPQGPQLRGAQCI